jgi:hypothetical protein
LPLARSQRLEIGRVIGAQNNRLAIEYCAIDPQRRERVPDAGEGLGIVGRGASPQALAVKPQSGTYSITSSARESNEGGTVRPSALAVFMLITSSNLVGCSIGKSAGLAPLRILST